MTDTHAVEGRPERHDAAEAPAEAGPEAGDTQRMPVTPAVLEMALQPEKVTGSADRLLADELFGQMAQALGIGRESDPRRQRERLGAALAALSGLGPRNTLEGMLATQMVVVHDMAMRMTARALEHGSMPEIADAQMRLGARFMAIWGKQADTLRRLRGQRTTKIRIEHVHKRSKARTAPTGEAERPQ